MPVRETRTVIGRLLRAHLVEAGAGGRRRMHDLQRLYAGQLSDAHADVDGRERVRDRLLAYYLDGARAADDHLRVLAGTPLPAVLTSRDNALAWLDAERPSLIAAVTMAASTGRDQVAMELPLNLGQYLSQRWLFDDWIFTLMVSRDAARRLGDRGNETRALGNLGTALWGRAGLRRRSRHIRTWPRSSGRPATCEPKAMRWATWVSR